LNVEILVAPHLEKGPHRSEKQVVVRHSSTASIRKKNNGLAIFFVAIALKKSA